MKSIQYSVDGTPVESPAHADVVTDETVKVDIVDTYEKKATTTETTTTATTEVTTTETTTTATTEVTTAVSTESTTIAATEVTSEVTTEATTAVAGPKTGDSSPIQVVMILGLTACLGAGVLIAENRRKNGSRK